MSYNQRGRGNRGRGDRYDSRDRGTHDDFRSRDDRGSYGDQSRYRDDRRDNRGDRRDDYGGRGYAGSQRGGFDSRRGGQDMSYNTRGGYPNMPYREGRGYRVDSSRGGRGGFRGGGGGGPPRQGGIYLAGQTVPQPDADVTKLENELVKNTRGKSFIIDGETMPGRPGYGRNGTSVVLRTNYVQLRTHQSKSGTPVVLHRYDIELKPEQASRARRRQLIEIVLAHLTSKDQGVLTDIVHTSDYARMLLTTQKLDETKQAQWQSELTFDGMAVNAASAQSSGQSNKTFQFRLVFTGSYSVHQLQEHLQSSSAGATFNNATDTLQMMNVVVLKGVNTAEQVLVTAQNKCFPVGAHLSKENTNLGGGLEALRGYFSSVRPAIGRILLNVNVCSGAFYKPIGVMALINELEGRLNDIDAFIRKLKIVVSYGGAQDKNSAKTSYRTIFGVVPANAHTTTFDYVDHNNPNAQPRSISVYNYYREHHNITLKNPDLPLLNVGSRDRPQWMPQELCTIKPGQQYRRLLSGDQTTAMLEFSARPPNVNAQSIAGDGQQAAKGLRLLRLTDPNNANEQDESIHPFGLHAETSLITVPGRVLQASKVRYSGRDANPSNGSWNCANQAFVKPGDLGTWSVINLDDPRDYTRDIEELIGFMRQYGLRSGNRLPTLNRRLSPLTMDNRSSNEKLLTDLFQQCASDRYRVKFVLVILREHDKWLHACIKSISETQFGILTQCTVGSKFSKQNGQGMYMANLALKINMKLGGVNHIIPDLLTGRLDEKTMLVGIDVTHPSPGSAKDAPSIACVVASVDKHCGQWPGSIRRQTSRQEMVTSTAADPSKADMVSNLTEMILERLDRWRKTNGTLPNKIVVFRDGVSEGQYSLVLSTELPSFHAAFKKAYGASDKWPKMAIIVVGKRHHTRFYPTSKETSDADGKRPSYNPAAGTVVDRGIVGRFLQDFFMQAHQGLQGTARPAHYVVIKDDIKFEADELQAFTHKLCYMFGRATKAVSVVPPVYFADLLAERAREYLFSTMSEGSLGSTRSGSAPEWDGSLHPAIGTTTWYV